MLLCYCCLLLAGADSSSGSSPQWQHSSTEYSSMQPVLVDVDRRPDRDDPVQVRDVLVEESHAPVTH